MGATPGPRYTEGLPFVASADLDKYLVVIQDTSGEGLMKAPTAANDPPLGVPQADVLEGEAGAVFMKEGDVVKVMAADAISIGDKVIINGTGGKIKTDPATATTTSQVLGVAETAATADEDIILVRIEKREVYNPA